MPLYSQNALYGRAHDPMFEDVASWLDGRARSKIHSCELQLNSKKLQIHTQQGGSTALRYA